MCYADSLVGGLAYWLVRNDLLSGKRMGDRLVGLLAVWMAGWLYYCTVDSWVSQLTDK